MSVMVVLWTRLLYYYGRFTCPQAIAPLDSITPAELVRLWAHEALRLFQDRLVLEEERKWTDELIDGTAEK